MNTASAGFGSAWAMVVALASVPLLLSGLGTAAFGTWVLLQTFSAITGWLSVADIGLGTAMTRLVAMRAATEDRPGAARAIGSGLALLSGVGLICAAGLALAGPELLPALFNTPARLVDDLRAATVLFSATVLADLATRGMAAVLEGFQRVDIARALDAARRTLVAAATIAVALRGGGLVGVAAAAAAASWVALAIAAAALARQLRAHAVGRPRFFGGDARDLVRYGSTVGALNATGVLHRTMDRLIAGAMFGPGGVALIEVATQVQNGAAAVLSSSSYVAMSSSPWLHARGDREALRQLLLRGTRYSLLVTLPVTTLAAVLAGPLVRLWVGREFSEAAGLTVLALVYIAVAGPLQVGQNLLQGIGSAGLVLRAAGAAVVVNLLASIGLAQLYGLAGVLLGTLVGTAVLVPPLARSVLAHTDTTGREFVRAAVVPAAVPAAAAGLAAAAGSLVPGVSDLGRCALGTVLGGIAFLPPALRWGLVPGELSGLGDAVGRRLRRSPALAAEHAADGAADDA